MRITLRSLPTLALLGLALAWAHPAQAEWQDVATISSTLGNTSGRLCVGGTGTDLGCPVTAPYVNTTTGYVGIGTTAPSLPLDIYREGSSSNIGLRTFGNANSVLSFFRAAGTIDTPTAITAGNTTATINGYGYNGSSYANNASIRMGSDNTIAGGRIFFLTASDGGLLQTHYLLNRHGLTALGSGNMINETPSTSLHVFGTIRIGTETSATLQTCDTDRTGAIKYTGGDFYVCRNGTTWETLATTGENSAVDRITSSSQAGVTANSSGYISLTTGGVTGTAYFTPASVLVNAGISTTGPISATDGYVANALAVGMPIRNAARKINVTNGLAVYSSTTSPGLYINYINADNSTAGLRLIFNRTTSLSTIQYDTGDGGNTEATNLVLDPSGSVGVNMMSGISGNTSAKSNNPSTTLHVSGTIRMADGGETCDSDRLGAIKYTGGTFSVCRSTSTGWEPLATTSSIDRITSGTTAVVTNSATSTVSFTLDGSTVAYMHPSLGLVTSGISATGTISGTQGYFSNIGIGKTATTALDISATWGGGNIGQISLGGPGAAGKINFRRGNDGSSQANLGYSSETETSNLQLTSNGGSGYLTFVAATYEKMRITKDGIGISTTAPTTALHIDGTLRIADGAESCDANRLGALKYASNQFYICQNTTNGWEPLATATSSTTPSINTGLSGSIVFRDEYGYLKARDSFSISATTGSVGIGAGAPVSVGSNGLYTSGNIRSGQNIDATGAITAGGNLQLSAGNDIRWDGSTGARIVGDGATTKYLAFTTSGTEAMRIVSTGYVGIGTATPNNNLVVNTSTNLGGITISSTGGHANAGLILKNGTYSYGLMITANGHGLGDGKLLIGDYSNASGIALATLPSGMRGIGINNYSPSTTLDISGSLKLRADSGVTSTCDTNRLGAIKYESNAFYICQNTSTGWESLATSSSNTTVAINTGLSGSIVFRDEYGVLKARDSFSISATTGSVGIGAGPSAYTGNSGLTAVGSIYTKTNFMLDDTQSLTWGNSNVKIIGDSGSRYLAINTSNTEALRIVSTGYVGIGTTAPSTTLHVVTAGNITAATTGAGVTVRDNTGRVLYMDGNELQTYNAMPLYLNRFGGEVGIGVSMPSTTLHVAGTLRIADGAESCDTSRLGALKYAAGAFYICQNTTNGWEPLATTGENSAVDRITSSSQAGVTANSTGYISLTTGGVTGTAYFQPNSVLVNAGISTTGPISATSGYLSTNLGIGQNPTAGYSLYAAQGIRTNTSFQAATGSGAYPAYTFANSNNTGIFLPENGSLAFTTSGTEALRIVSSGYVGIGIAAPSTTLHVSGTAYANQLEGGIYNSNNNPTVRITSAGIFGRSAADYNAFTLNPNSYATFRTSMGVGTNFSGTPSATLHISGTLRLANGGESCDTDRLGAIKYASGAFSICQNTTTGWESLATSSSNTTVAINTGLSGSIVFRDEYGVLKARDSFSISSTTGSVGVGAGAPASIGSNALYASGYVWSSTGFGADDGNQIRWGNSRSYIKGDGTNINYLAFTTSGTEAMRIVSTAFVGIGTTQPSTTLHVVGGAGLRIGTLGSAGKFSLIDSNYVNWTMQPSGTTQFVFTNNGDANYYYSLYNLNGYNTRLGINTPATPSTTLHVSGTLRLADGGENCDTNRLGALKYASNQFYICRNGSTWETLVAGASGSMDTDRITSGTDAVTVNDATNTVSFTQNGTTTAYINNGQLVAGSISTTGTISGTSLYAGSLNATTASLTTVATGNVSTTGGISVTGNVSANQFIGDGSLLTNISVSAISGLQSDRITSGTASVIANQNNTVSISASRILAGTFTGTTPDTLYIGLKYTTNPTSNTTAIGPGAAASNNGLTVTALGNNAAIANTGDSVTALGAYAAQNNSGSNAVIVGQSAASFNTGGYIVAVGGNALFNNKAENSVAVGYGSMMQNTFGLANTSIGYRALAYNQTGSYNTALGHAAGQGVNGNSFSANTLLGSYTGTALTTGSSNTLVGANSGMTLTTGENNILLGAGLTTPAATTSNYLSIGNAIFGDIASGLGYANKIGINVAAPSVALEVSGTISATNITLNGQSLENALQSDRITSGTTAVTANTTGTISLTTGGVTTGYFDTAGNLIAPGVSLTGAISATRGYVGGGWNTNSAGDYQFSVDGELGILGGTSIQFNAGGVRTWLNHRGFYTNEGSPRSYYFSASSGALLGVNTTEPSTTLHVSGTLLLANGGESCDADRLGAIKYTSNAFYICQNTSTGWESLATTSSNTTVAINTGLSGSIVFRDEYGVLKARDSFNISSTTGSVGIGAGAPDWLGNNGLYSAGMVYASSYRASNGGAYGFGSNYSRITGDGTSSNYIAFTTSSTEAMRIVSTGYVGIGTSAPDSQLTLRSASGFSSSTITFTNDSATAYQRLGGIEVRRHQYDSAGRAAGIYFYRGNSTNEGELALAVNLSTSGAGAQPSERLRIYQNGKIGIGATTAASTTLDVSGTLKLADSGETCDTSRLGAIKYASGAFSICQNTTTGWEPLLTSGSVSADRISSGTTSIVAYSNTSLTFTVSGTQRAVMAADGSFGVNTSAPSARLHVHGTSLFSDALFSGSYTGGAGIGISSTSTGGGKFYLIASANGGANGGGNFSIYDNAAHSHRLLINSSGKVGIGVGYPSTTLHLAGTLRLADGAESCDADRLGALRYASNQFYVCRNGTAWETLVAGSSGSVDTDRITSGTTLVTANSTTTTISFTTGGTTTAYVHPTLGLVAPGVSTTGPISGTTGYFNGELRATGDVYGSRYFGSELWLDNDGYLHWSNDTYIIGNGINHELRFGANNADAMIIASTSYVGIGTMTPTAELEVSGTVKASGAIQAGNADTTCAGSADYGKMRFDEATRKMYLCRP